MSNHPSPQIQGPTGPRSGSACGCGVLLLLFLLAAFAGRYVPLAPRIGWASHRSSTGGSVRNWRRFISRPRRRSR
jgi:hypothetical protein